MKNLSDTEAEMQKGVACKNGVCVLIRRFPRKPPWKTSFLRSEFNCDFLSFLSFLDTFYQVYKGKLQLMRNSDGSQSNFQTTIFKEQNIYKIYIPMSQTSSRYH